MADDYDQYVRAEWKRFVSNAARDVMARDLLSGIAQPRVLDVGCGAAQEHRR